ncbi:serine protein kinase RIO [Nakamurella sp. GG22]
MPRFRLTGITSEHTDHDSDIDDLHDAFDDKRTPRRRRPTTDSGPRVVAQGKSGRAVVEIDSPVDRADEFGGAASVDGSAVDGSAVDGSAVDGSAADGATDTGSPYSSYDVATHGPDPVPDWLVTSLSALDTRLGTIKSGKEADVALLDRSLPGGPGCLLAVKTFRSAEHRMFHRDAGYLEGRRVRRSRETRAMAARTGFGRELLAGQWAASEFAALSSIWKAGARVPYPVQLIGSEVMMEFIGEPDGSAAPRLAAYDADTAEFTDLWHDLVASLEVLAESGVTHGDLSPYNVLVDEQGCVLIDLPQVVDLVANPQGLDFLDRDCRNIAEFFARRGVLAADAETLALHLAGLAVP